MAFAIEGEQLFWQKVEDWKRSQGPIAIKGRQQPSELSAIVTIKDFISGRSVTLHDANTGREWTMDLVGAEIRALPFDLVEAISAFAAIWDEPEEEHSASCTFTELRVRLN